MQPGLDIFEVTDPDSHWLPKVFNLFERTQGKNISSLEYVQRCARSPQEQLLVGIFEKQLIAASAAKILQDDFTYYEPFDTDLVKKWHNKTVGSLSVVSVEQDYRGKGYARALCQQQIQWLKSHDCTPIISISWVNGTPHNSARVFESLGMRKAGQRDDFYIEWSTKIGLECPVCRTPPCRCPAILYILD